MVMLRAQGHGSDFQRRIQHGVQICVQYITLLVEKKTLIQCLGETVQHSYNNKTIPPTPLKKKPQKTPPQISTGLFQTAVALMPLLSAI